MLSLAQNAQVAAMEPGRGGSRISEKGDGPLKRGIGLCLCCWLQPSRGFSRQGQKKTGKNKRVTSFQKVNNWLAKRGPHTHAHTHTHRGATDNGHTTESPSQNQQHRLGFGGRLNILNWSHTFVDIDHEKVSTVNSRRVVIYKRKYVLEVLLVNCLVKLVQEKVRLLI